MSVPDTALTGDITSAPTWRSSSSYSNPSPRDRDGRPRGAIVAGLSLSLPPVPTASRVARSAVRDHFADALNRDVVSDLELVVSELVTNGVEHGRGTVQLAVEHSGWQIHGSVTDDGNGFDYTLPNVTSQGLRGRGLAIVDALVTRWGIRRGSTHVWFDITLIGS
jgi:anti-sigma regulatory factor (Ser/Thr protein kinase)